MLRRLIEGLFLLAAVLFAAALGAARLWPQPDSGFYWRAAAIAQMPQDLGPLDFTDLKLRARPNYALTCPESICAKAKPYEIAPVFSVPAAELRRKISIVAEAAPNTVEMACAPDCDKTGRFVQYSPLFRFPDVVDVRVIEAGAKASTLAIYSRSVFGYWDLGVNAERNSLWIAALQRITPLPQ